jgi:hypothetical protein
MHQKVIGTTSCHVQTYFQLEQKMESAYIQQAGIWNKSPQGGLILSFLKRDRKERKV